MIFGILFIFFIGKTFYQLAESNNKSKWGYGILGVVVYYVGTIIGGVSIYIGSIMLEYETFVDETNDTVLSIIAIPFGFLSCWGLYKLLKSRWSNSKLDTSSDILDSGIMQ